MTTNYLLTIVLSIFLMLNICSAQDYNKKGDFSLCNKKPGEISKTELLEMLKSDCSKINLYSNNGIKLRVVEFTFAYSPKSGEAAYFEMVKGKTPTKTIIQKIEEAQAGTLIVFTNLICENGRQREVYDGGSFTITE